MSILRALALWLLILAIPVQSLAAMAMAHCKDVPMQGAATAASAPHDHAAMMRQMAAVASSDQADAHAHHAMADEASSADQLASAATESDGTAKALGCDCGCDCSGNCAMTCAASVVSLIGSSSHTAFTAVTLHPVLARSQAQPAHRFTPLRPPSAAAI